jgi:hypothetical protein
MATDLDERSLLGVVAMLVGALVGAVLLRHRGPGLPLAISPVAAAVTAVVARYGGAARELDKEVKRPAT